MAALLHSLSLSLSHCTQYLIAGVLFQHIYVLLYMQKVYVFSLLFEVLSWLESLFCLFMLIDVCLIAIGQRILFMVVSVPEYKAET